jgi:hypothetical protein
MMRKTFEVPSNFSLLFRHPVLRRMAAPSTVALKEVIPLCGTEWRLG